MGDEDLAVKVGAWLSWRFEFRLDEKDGARLIEHIQKVTKGATALGDYVHFDLTHNGSATIDQVKDARFQSSLDRLSFGIRYLVEGLVSRGLIGMADTSDLLRMLGQCCQSEEHKTRVLESFFVDGAICNLEKAVTGKRDEALLMADRAKQLGDFATVHSRGLARVHSCVVTPTRLLLFPPALEVSNELLRRFQSQQDRFIVVTFADEDDAARVDPVDLEADTASPAKGTVARIRRALHSGLTIAGRHYVFLGYGTTSIRYRRCWFMAEDPGNDFTPAVVWHKLGLPKVSPNVLASQASEMHIVSSGCHLR